MPEESKADIAQAQSLILALNDARQKEIEAVRSRMELFLTGQLELKHDMEVVAKGQDNLKERFEQGVSKTLSELNKKFDTFMVEWGRKLEQDSMRDERIKDTKEKAETADKKGDAAIEAASFYGKWILISVIAGLALGGLALIFPRIHG